MAIMLHCSGSGSGDVIASMRLDSDHKERTNKQTITRQDQHALVAFYYATVRKLQSTQMLQMFEYLGLPVGADLGQCRCVLVLCD